MLTYCRSPQVESSLPGWGCWPAGLHEHLHSFHLSAQSTCSIGMAAVLFHNTNALFLLLGALHGAQAVSSHCSCLSAGGLHRYTSQISPRFCRRGLTPQPACAAGAAAPRG